MGKPSGLAWKDLSSLKNRVMLEWKFKRKKMKKLRSIIVVGFYRRSKMRSMKSTDSD